ncbi:hypothetical protein D0817_18260 [Flavobacterium cupreum]|uniref:TIGR04255 family protein n=2 Tax=Flavobacterium TaxID=237 RepID=A0A434A3F3_9FLAO|nr:hypothetical protein D0817_18260 [Flavobacterium cupreum]
MSTIAQVNNLDKNTINSIIGVIDKRDVNCKSEIERAKMDFKFQEIFYYIEPEGYLDSDSKRHHPYLNTLLKKRGIEFCESPETEFALYYIGDDVESYPAITNCYYKASNELLNLKYGRNFTKDIEKTADSMYVMSRIDNPFQYPAGVDHYCIVYPKTKDFLDQKLQIQQDFFSTFKYPIGFIYSTDKKNFMARTKFTIQRDNTICNIEIDLEFKNSENQKFYNYLVNQLTAFIKNANWNAAVSSEIKVNSIFTVNFYN